MRWLRLPFCMCWDAVHRGKGKLHSYSVAREECASLGHSPCIVSKTRPNAHELAASSWYFRVRFPCFLTRKSLRLLCSSSGREGPCELGADLRFTVGTGGGGRAKACAHVPKGATNGAGIAARVFCLVGLLFHICRSCLSGMVLSRIWQCHFSLLY